MPTPVPRSDFDVSALSQPSRDALKTVSTATQFSLGGIGVVGSIAPPETALRVLLEDPKAVDALRHLAATASAAGRLYALVGLYVLDRPTFESTAARLRKELGDTKAECISGCMIHEETVSATIDQIGSGAFDPYLMSWSTSPTKATTKETAQ